MVESRRRVLAAVGASFTLAGCLGGGTDGARPSPTDTATSAGPATVAVGDHVSLGDILVDGEGMTLYMFDSDTQGGDASSCTGGCAEAWPPLTVAGDPSAGESVAATLSTIQRESGEAQVVANGWPLYYYASDGAPGDATGQGANDVWWVIDPAGEPVRETPTDSGGDDPY